MNSQVSKGEVRAVGLYSINSSDSWDEVKGFSFEMWLVSGVRFVNDEFSD